jgi:hypothetical protein
MLVGSSPGSRLGFAALQVLYARHPLSSLTGALVRHDVFHTARVHPRPAGPPSTTCTWPRRQHTRLTVERFPPVQVRAQLSPQGLRRRRDVSPGERAEPLAAENRPGRQAARTGSAGAGQATGFGGRSYRCFSPTRLGQYSGPPRERTGKRGGSRLRRCFKRRIGGWGCTHTAAVVEFTTVLELAPRNWILSQAALGGRNQSRRALGEKGDDGRQQWLWGRGVRFPGGLPVASEANPREREALLHRPDECDAPTRLLI